MAAAATAVRRRAASRRTSHFSSILDGPQPFDHRSVERTLIAGAAGLPGARQPLEARHGQVRGLDADHVPTRSSMAETSASS